MNASFSHRLSQTSNPLVASTAYRRDQESGVGIKAGVRRTTGFKAF